MVSLGHLAGMLRRDGPAPGIDGYARDDDPGGEDLVAAPGSDGDTQRGRATILVRTGTDQSLDADDVPVRWTTLKQVTNEVLNRAEQQVRIRAVSRVDHGT